MEEFECNCSLDLFFSSSLHSLLPELLLLHTRISGSIRHRIDWSSMTFRFTIDGCFWTPLLSVRLFFPPPPFFYSSFNFAPLHPFRSPFFSTHPSILKLNNTHSNDYRSGPVRPGQPCLRRRRLRGGCQLLHQGHRDQRVPCRDLPQAVCLLFSYSWSAMREQQGRESCLGWTLRHKLKTRRTSVCKTSDWEGKRPKHIYHLHSKKVPRETNTLSSCCSTLCLARPPIRSWERTRKLMRMPSRPSLSSRRNPPLTCQSRPRLSSARGTLSFTFHHTYHTLTTLLS